MTPKQTRDYISQKVDSFKTKHKAGFTWDEIETLLEDFKGINMEKFHDSMYGNTCQLIDGEVIRYPQDVYMALVCGVENRDLTIEEWD